MLAPLDTIEMLAERPDHAVARFSGVLMYRLWRSPSVEVLRDMSVAHQAETARAGRRSINLCFIEPECSLDFGEEKRRVATEQLRTAHEYMLCQCVILLKPGFVAAVTRSVIASVYRVGGIKVPVNTVAAMEDGAGWVAQQGRAAGHTLGEAELLAATRRFRGRPRPPA